MMRRFINPWGIAALIVFVGDFWLSGYSFDLQDSGKEPLFSTTTNCEQAIVANLVAGVCAYLASRHGHWSWRFLILLSAWFAIVNFLCEL
jgi:hypothetical protein